jgi:hypothetical protein
MQCNKKGPLYEWQRIISTTNTQIILTPHIVNPRAFVKLVPVMRLTRPVSAPTLCAHEPLVLSVSPPQMKSNLTASQTPNPDPPDPK